MPWLVKNYVYTGNPFYPALYNLLGGRDMNATVYAGILADSHHPALGQAAAGLLKNLWGLFLAGPATIHLTYGSASYLGPLLLMFLPLIFLVRGVSAAIKRLCLFAAALYVLWDMAFPQARFLYPALAIAAIISSYSLTRIAGGAPRPFRAAMFSVAALCLAFNLCLGVFEVNRWGAAHGLESLHETGGQFLARLTGIGNGKVLSSVPIYDIINDGLDRDARVLIIGDAEHLYINRRHLYTYWSATTPYEVFRDKAGRPAEVSAALKAEGITDIVYSPAEMVRLQRHGAIGYPERDDPLIDDFLKSGYVRLVARSDATGTPVFLFEVI